MLLWHLKTTLIKYAWHANRAYISPVESISRDNGGQPVWLHDDDRYRFCPLFQESTVRFGYRIHAFCLMTNHLRGAPKRKGPKEGPFSVCRVIAVYELRQSQRLVRGPLGSRHAVVQADAPVGVAGEDQAGMGR